MDIVLLRQQHDAIEAISSELAAIVMADAPRPVGAVRWRLARELIGHLAVEDRWFYPHLIGNGPANAAQMARAFKAEMGELAAEFTQYIADWSDQRIAKDWGAFGRETGSILDALHNRIRRENELLYPLCEVASQADIVRFG